MITGVISLLLKDAGCRRWIDAVASPIHRAGRSYCPMFETRGERGRVASLPVEAESRCGVLQRVGRATRIAILARGRRAHAGSKLLLQGREAESELWMLNGPAIRFGLGECNHRWRRRSRSNDCCRRRRRHSGWHWRWGRLRRRCKDREELRFLPPRERECLRLNVGRSGGPLVVDRGKQMAHPEQVGHEHRVAIATLGFECAAIAETLVLNGDDRGAHVLQLIAQERDDRLGVLGALGYRGRYPHCSACGRRVQNHVHLCAIDAPCLVPAGRPFRPDFSGQQSDALGREWLRVDRLLCLGD